MDDTVFEYRLVLPEFLSSRECKELMWIHKSCGVVGYRPGVLSTTLCHLVATNCANLILPLLPIRERVKEVVEEYFGREYELFTEFTAGLKELVLDGTVMITDRTYGNGTTRSAAFCVQSRQYCRFREDGRAVCYLNNHGEDFEGGLFHFEKGDPQTIVPTTGTIVIYTADEKNIHIVDQITGGERYTLALWFTLDKVHNEDEKLIQQLDSLNFDVCDSLPNQKFEQGLNLRLPVSAPSLMYNLNGNIQREEPPEGLPQPLEELPVNDVRVGRMTRLGFSCCYTSEVSGDEQDQPLEVVFRGEKVPGVFSNLLHALQVIQFHQYRLSSKNQESSSGEEELERGSKMSTPSSVQSTSRESSTVEEIIFGKVQAELDLGCHLVSMSDRRWTFNSHAEEGSECQNLETEVLEVSDFSNSWKEWNAYSSNRWEQLFRLLPLWKLSRMFDLLHP